MAPCEVTQGKNVKSQVQTLYQVYFYQPQYMEGELDYISLSLHPFLIYE